MKTKILIVCAAALSGCASPLPSESPLYAERMSEAGERYTACITAEAEKDMKSPARVEDIAVAAHGRCWAQWEAYRKATSVNYAYGAGTPEQIQYARDRTEAHLRQFEQEARRSLVDSVVQRNMPGVRP